MKTDPSDNDPLDSLLRAPQPPLPGAEFTARVLAALPASPRSAPRGVNPLWWVLGGALSGVLFAEARGASWRALLGSVAGLTETLVQGAGSATHAWLILALVTTALSLLLSFIITHLCAAPARSIRMLDY